MEKKKRAIIGGTATVGIGGLGSLIGLSAYNVQQQTQLKDYVKEQIDNFDKLINSKVDNKISAETNARLLQQIDQQNKDHKQDTEILLNKIASGRR